MPSLQDQVLELEKKNDSLQATVTQMRHSELEMKAKAQEANKLVEAWKSQCFKKEDQIKTSKRKLTEMQLQYEPQITALKEELKELEKGSSTFMEKLEEKEEQYEKLKLGLRKLDTLMSVELDTLFNFIQGTGKSEMTAKDEEEEIKRCLVLISRHEVQRADRKWLDRISHTEQLLVEKNSVHAEQTKVFESHIKDLENRIAGQEEHITRQKKQAEDQRQDFVEQLHKRQQAVEVVTQRMAEQEKKFVTNENALKQQIQEQEQEKRELMNELRLREMVPFL